VTRTIDPHYLKSQQYQNSLNLEARIQLHQRFSTNKYGWPKWVFDHLVIPSESRILELGCGTALLWLENSGRIPDDWSITLSDFSPGMLEQAQRNLQGLGRTFNFEMINAQQIAWGNESCEAVIANHMLYHVPERARALAEIRRILKPGGRLYAATNGLHHQMELRTLIQEIDPAADQANPATEFGLENGREQLAEHFDEVHLYVYKDSLRVTEVEPLVAYILSMQYSQAITNQPTDLIRLIEQKLKERGHIYITKSSGLFEAQKG
jgi:ubiquinone/menaquinone biosynthesis C-methylase UbiE